MSQLKRKDNKGFLLLEVMLSVFIIASALMFIIRAYMVSMKATDASRRTQKVCLAAEEMLFELDAKGQLQEGVSSGSLQEGAYDWQVSAQAADEEREINLLALEVGPARGTGRRIKITTYIKNKTT